MLNIKDERLININKNITNTDATSTRNKVLEKIKKEITTIDKKINDTYGDPDLLILENLFDICFSFDINRIVLEDAIILEFPAERVDIKAEIGSNIKKGPIILSAAMITEDTPNEPFRTESTTISIKRYNINTKKREINIALGIFFLGVSTSWDILVIA
jgi:hypothetical protein